MSSAFATWQQMDSATGSQQSQQHNHAAASSLRQSSLPNQMPSYEALHEAASFRPEGLVASGLHRLGSLSHYHDHDEDHDIFRRDQVGKEGAKPRVKGEEIGVHGAGVWARPAGAEAAVLALPKISAADVGEEEQQQDTSVGGAGKEEVGAAVEVAAVPKLKPMKIVMLVVGTRGDVQPFIAIGLRLQQDGHQVRLASHAVYRDFIKGFGLDFFPLGGNPRLLSEFVVKHRGIIPTSYKDTVQSQQHLEEIIMSVPAACTQLDPDDPSAGTYQVDAIIANPLAYGQYDVAQFLDVPLFLQFTMPWTPTKAFPSPWVSSPAAWASRMKKHTKKTQGTKSSRSWRQGCCRGGDEGQPRYLEGQKNYLTWILMEDLAWLGVKRGIARMRRHVLGMRPGRRPEGALAMHSSRTPVTYFWSEALVPKPPDWGPHISVVGTVTLPISSLQQYNPPEELTEFLNAGPPPVFVGFGSAVAADPAKLTQIIVKAATVAGVRMLISAGWSKLELKGQASKDIKFLGNVPHDWLFPRCSAVVHHGGAGTTFTGLLAGRPTLVVPFFGDQSFWGYAVSRVGAGPPPISVEKLSVRRLVSALKVLQTPAVRQAAQAVAQNMLLEDGAAKAVEAFYRYIHETVPDLTRAPSGVTLHRTLTQQEGMLDQHQDSESDSDEEEVTSSAAAKLIRKYRPSMQTACYPCAQLWQCLRRGSGRDDRKQPPPSPSWSEPMLD